MAILPKQLKIIAMKTTNKNVLNYVMNDMAWKIDLPKFLKEIQECTKSAPYSASFNIVRYVLSILAERAIELDDPVLNIIMLNLSLYEGSHDDDAKDVIEKLRKEIKEKNNDYGTKNR